MIKVEINNSKFTAKHLKQLANKNSAYQSPLAVIAHIDANAFFAQVEQIRLGLSVEDPVVCVQWNSLIAVSYAAREYGISRMDSVGSARLKCPNLKPVHTAVFKKGENYWRYHDDDESFPDPIDHKVSLDPYRRESRKILKIIKSRFDLVEKASVDECFIDMGRSVISKLLDLKPELQDILGGLQLDDNLPDLKDLSLPVKGFLVDEEDLVIKDYDDLFIVMGSSIMDDMRTEIYENLGYTTSCGIARVKTIAKLASGFKKPNNQTIVRNSKIEQFLKNFDITDFWSMGGKTGEYIKIKLPSTDETIESIRRYDLSELTAMLEDPQLSLKLYQMIRGEYQQPLSERIVLKSMNSNKNLRGTSGKTHEDAVQWIRVFAADLKQRVIELNDENSQLTRAKTISIHFRNFASTNMAPKSKQSSLPFVSVDELEETLYKYGVNLLKILETQYDHFYPLTNLNMTINNFEFLDNNDQNILHFTKKGDVNDVFKDISARKEVKNKGVVKGDYVYNDDDTIKCLKCNVIVEDTTEHTDYHYALKLMKEINGSGSVAELNNKNSTTARQFVRSSTPSKVTKPILRKNTKYKSNVDKNQSKLPF